MTDRNIKEEYNYLVWKKKRVNFENLLLSRIKNVTQHQISQWIEYEYDLLAKIQDKDQMFLIALNTDWYYNDYGHDGSRNMRSNKMWKAYWIPRKNLGWEKMNKTT